jgi:hypothetical protein
VNSVGASVDSPVASVVLVQSPELVSVSDADSADVARSALVSVAVSDDSVDVMSSVLAFSDDSDDVIDSVLVSVAVSDDSIDVMVSVLDSVESAVPVVVLSAMIRGM